LSKHRSHSIEFKRQVAQEFLGGETLHSLAKRHDISRNLIRVWVEKYQAGAFDDDAQAAALMQAYEARIAALERLVGKQALELEFLKGALRSAPRPRSATTSAIDARLALSALRAAVASRRPPPGCVHHSDRGVPICCGGLSRAARGLVGSMGRRGNPYDNAKAESFMKTLKVEAIYPMAFESFEDVAAYLPRFIEAVYNRRRLRSTCLATRSLSARSLTVSRRRTVTPAVSGHLTDSCAPSGRRCWYSRLRNTTGSILIRKQSVRSSLSLPCREKPF
jgi:transposase-like protein